MRIVAVNLTGVGGLPDGRVALPTGPLAALAGANGTGKSKLLACILAPWSGQVPTPRRPDQDAEVLVELTLTEAEREALSSLSERVGWGPAEVPSEVRVGVRRGPLIGQSRISEPAITVLAHAWEQTEFLSANPTLNVTYLPAERRLLEPRQQGIDLNQLSEPVLFQKNVDARAGAWNYGRLDDQEFESFAKALCVAAALPSDDDDPPPEHAARISWEDFKSTVDALIAPKKLLGLTQSHPDQLRIQTPDHNVHSVRDLSSGERQALIIMSRVFGSGSLNPLVMIDEPDAYLHPHLSKRLILALEDGVGSDGQLIVATHSPSILDGIPPSDILRLQHGQLPEAIADESERLELYRSAGFRSSALTQSDLLVITEGSTDIAILGLAIPELSRASILPANGKAQVFRQVEQLKPFDLPVLGVVDRDLDLTAAPHEIRDDVFTWPTADIEGLYLSEAAALESMIEHGMIKAEYGTVEKLAELVDRLCDSHREEVIAEFARARAINIHSHEWPSPRGNDALERLRSAVDEVSPISPDQLEEAISAAEELWEGAAGKRLTVVRGKYILSSFATTASEMKSGRALVEATARHRPDIPAISELSTLVSERLDRSIPGQRA